MTRPASHLVLDIGGVLLADPMPVLFNRLAQAGELPCTTVQRFYLTQLRERLWSGDMREDEFWSRLLGAARLSSSEAAAWREEFLSWQDPLPAVGRLAGWSERATIVLLSNHRSAWVRPALAAAGIAIPPSVDPAHRGRAHGTEAAAKAAGAIVTRALISEETGLVKPDAAAFRAATASAEPGTRCLLVDDQSPNVESAVSAGLPAVQADREGRWIHEVEAWLAA